MERVRTISLNREGYIDPETSLYSRLLNVLDLDELNGVTKSSFFWEGEAGLLFGWGFCGVGMRTRKHFIPRD